MSTNQSPFQSGVEYDFGQPRSFSSFTLESGGTSFGSPKQTGQKHFRRGHFIGPANDGQLTFQGRPVGENKILYFKVPKGTSANRR